MRASQPFRFGIAITLLLSIGAWADVRDDDLKSAYVGKVLTLRQFYSGPQLRFDANGNLIGSGWPDAWTVAGQIRVEHISLKNGVLDVRGQRLFLFYDSDSKSLRDVGSLSKDDPARKRFSDKLVKWYAKTSKVEIQIGCGDLQTQDDATKSMNAVFVPPDEPLADAVPAFWKNWLKRQAGEAAKPADNLKAIDRVGKGVSPPKVTYDPDPAYSEIARQARYQAVTVLWLVIAADGPPQDIHILKPAGMGLDEEAVRAVQTWKFNAAMKDGQPVPVQINVEVNFRLY